MTGDLRAFFEPRSVAIVGASRTPGKAGYEVLKNILENGYQGKIYPVNPEAQEILALKAYPSLMDIHEDVDLAIIVVPAARVVQVLKTCAAKGVKAAIVETGGFSEVGEEGAKLESEIVNVAKQSGVRIIGPNTNGVTSTFWNFTTTFFPLGRVRRGPIAYVAQTGNFASHTMKWILTSENFGVSRVIGLGNKCDVDDAEVLEFLGNDPHTKAIFMYIEGFKDGRRFIDVAREVSHKKPIVALKAGRTRTGIQAAYSHTASLATDDLKVDAAFRQAGIVRVRKYNELINAAKALAFQPLPRSNRVGILAPSGAMNVIAADACESIGLDVTDLSAETLATLEEISPPYVAIRNPVDMSPAAQVHGMEYSYRIGMDAVLSDPRVDAVVSILRVTPQDRVENMSFIPGLSQKHPNKPLFIIIPSDKSTFEEAKAFLENKSIPVYPPFEDAFEALDVMFRCSQNLRRF
jgi:acyl-CoA synthetase (NDP forming)